MHVSIHTHTHSGGLLRGWNGVEIKRIQVVVDKEDKKETFVCVEGDISGHQIKDKQPNYVEFDNHCPSS
jgi:hypothetical protein